ncbi:hypothetical protein PG994_004685 [Apiospora phragmitis]|uniref:Uncharacterized protein n=1 Tax=Apiospora phragmitis TaxID=2905665 RepID=A0ABR1VRA7_9PEZI
MPDNTEHERFEEGKENSHLANDSSKSDLFHVLGMTKPSTHTKDISTEDQRSIANRLGAEEHKDEGHEDSLETRQTKKDPTLPAKAHGNKPSRGAEIDAEIQADEEEMLAKKKGNNMPGKKN